MYTFDAAAARPAPLSLHTTIHELLKDRTKQLHERLHTHPRLAPLRSGHLTRPQYAEILATLIGWYRPLEAGIAGYLDQPSRIKQGLIAADLLELGVDAQALPNMLDRPAIDGLPDAFGASYVMEGATLGGSVLASAIRAALGPTAPLRFYGCYGDRRGHMWQQFIATLTMRLNNPDERMRAVATARSCFEALSDWLDKAPGLPCGRPT